MKYIAENVTEELLQLTEESMTEDEIVEMKKRERAIIDNIFKLSSYEAKLLAHAMFRKGYLAAKVELMTTEDLKVSNEKD